MANSVPTLTNENFHMFEPSPIETSLAANVDNPMAPSARGNLFRYQTQNQLNGQNYQHQVDQMHAAQIAEAMMAQHTQRMTAAGTLLKDAGGTPGMAPVLQSMGLVDPGIDLSAIGAGADATAAAKRMHDVGLGAGSAAQGGFTGLAPAVSSAFGPGVEQGSPALVQAAALRAAASGNGANGGALRGSLDDDGGVKISGKMRPGETVEEFKARAGGGTAPPTFQQRAAQQRTQQNSGGLVPSKGFGTNLPQAPGFVGGDGTDNPLLGGIPQDMMPTQTTTQAAAPATAQPSSDIAKNQVTEAIRKSLPAIQKSNPAAYADIHAAGAINPVPYKGSWGVKGASGTVYPLGGIAAQ